MEPGVIIALITFFGTVVPVLINRMLDRRKDKGGERRADYQDTQDDLTATREELRAYRAESQDRISGLELRVIALDNEVVVLRTGVVNGEIPPLGPRPLTGLGSSTE